MQSTFSVYQDNVLGRVACLQSGQLKAEVATEYGSNLISLSHAGRELLHTNREQLREHAYTGCFVLYPFPNRIRDRQFIFEGQAYDLSLYPKIVNDDALIHGVAHDGKWTVEGEPVTDENEVIFTTSFVWDESQKYFHTFPLPSKLVLEYHLSDHGIRIEYTIHNTGSENIPVGFALHPSFKRLSGDETTLSIPAASVMRMDEKLLPTGEVLDVSQVMFRQFDLRTPVVVNSALRLDHVFTDLVPGAVSVISHPTENLAVHVSASEDCKYIVLHTLGKDQTIEIEPQTCSTDALNAQDLESAGVIIIAPGAAHNGFIAYGISSKE